MTIPRIRTRLYQTARQLGDLNATLTGRIPQRIARRTTGRLAARILGWLHR